MKNPMDKNGLKAEEPSRNDRKGKESGITTAAGTPVYSNEDSMTSGVRGPVALQDVWLIEKLAHFDREVIPDACQGLRSLGQVHRNARYISVYQG